MKFAISFLSVMCVSGAVYAQSSKEYVELLCGSKEKIALVYSSDPIEDVMFYKMREQKFWKDRTDDALVTAKLLNEKGPEAVQSSENIATTMAALKACKAYFLIESDIKTYLKTQACVDDKGLEYDIEEAGFSCRLLMPK